MVDNIERVLERGEKIELLVDKTDNLRFQVCYWFGAAPCTDEFLCYQQESWQMLILSQTQVHQQLFCRLVFPCT